MDCTFDELLVQLNDPKQRDNIIRTVKENAVSVVDEFGELFHIVKCRDIAVPQAIVLGSGIPKGSHWLGNLIYFLLQEGPLEEKTSISPPVLGFVPADLANMPSPRILCTHRRPESIPPGVFSKKVKTFLLYRNPKDVAVSLYHHFSSMQAAEFRVSWSCHIENWMKGIIPLGDYFEYYKTWEKFLKEEKPDVLILSFEDLKKNGIGEMKKIQDFLGLSHSEKRLKEVLDKCTLDKLKKDVEEGKVWSPLLSKEGKSFLYRKGVIGDWKNHFTVAQNEKMDALIAEKGESSIYKLQFC